MERIEVLDMMGELKLYGMKAAYDETLATALKRQHEPQRFVGDLLHAEIAEKHARSIEWVVALIDGLRRLRGFSRLRTVPVLGRSVQNLHLVGHDFDCRALFAFRALPLPGLQPAFQVNVPALIQVFAANLRQAGEADDLKPLHPFPGSACCVFPPLVDRKAERTDGLALLAEFKFRRITQKPDQSYSVHTLAHELCPPSSSKRNLRLTRSPASTSI